ncbi:hypothetical protein BB341_14795 [Streptomyces clavuligerus]|uniref:Beta/gamma crystallin 'Greek key' domain-containing protein n=2 Tax=Streptomyces clavuligerus TaxID=1901 RepID=E2PUN8_STRCL|nr:hypothetical protein BB341_14795 [Streptomyces clavuligerus]EFG07817.1 Hypothetical protein SCLAV_2745 [Streptomyces clavuligerus]
MSMWRCERCVHRVGSRAVLESAQRRANRVNRRMDVVVPQSEEMSAPPARRRTGSAGPSDTPRRTMAFTPFRSSAALAIAAGLALVLGIPGPATAADGPAVLEVRTEARNMDDMVHVATAWEHTFYGGAHISFYARDCRTAGSQILDSLPPGWNDRLSSMQVYSQCSVRLYRELNRQGPYVWLHAGKRIPDLWADNDLTSSMLFMAP